jgi:hypothetical protein
MEMPQDLLAVLVAVITAVPHVLPVKVAPAVPADSVLLQNL